MPSFAKWLTALVCFTISLQSSFDIDQMPIYLIMAFSTLYLVYKLEMNDFSNLPKFNWRIIGYFVWLLKEIIASALSMTRLILQFRITINPQVSRITTQQKNNLTNTILAHSITLTPGTITVKVGDQFLVHSITAKHARGLQNTTMDKKLARVIDN